MLRHSPSVQNVCPVGTWLPFDVSGHTLICTISLLFLLTETIYVWLRAHQRTYFKMFVAILATPVVFFYLTILSRTCLYYHVYFDKIMGCIFGIVAYYVAYFIIDSSAPDNY